MADRLTYWVSLIRTNDTLVRDEEDSPIRPEKRRIIKPLSQIPETVGAIQLAAVLDLLER